MTDSILAAPIRTISRVLVIAGAPETGCTSIATNAAIAAAVTGTSTLLIDGTEGEAGNTDLVFGPGGLALVPRTTRDATRAHWDNPPPSLGETVLVICDAGHTESIPVDKADHVLVVTNTEAASLDATYGCIKRLAFHHGLDGVGIVINRAGNVEQAAAQAERMATLTRHFLGTDLPLLGWLPESPEVGRAALAGSAFILEAQDCPASRSVHSIAERLIPHPTEGDLSTQNRISK